MPINRKYNIAELMKACRNYFEVTGRRVSFEYTLISGKNDAKTDAVRLARVIREPAIHITMSIIHPPNIARRTVPPKIYFQRQQYNLLRSVLYHA